MKSIYTIIFSFFISVVLYGQGIDILLIPTKDCDDRVYCTSIELQTNSLAGDPVYIGTSSLLMTFDERVIAFESYNSANFNGGGLCTGWSPQQFDDFSRKGELEVTLVLSENGHACPAIGNTAVAVGTVCFDIIQQGASPNIQFDLANTQFNENVNDDGTAQILVSSAAAIDEINVLTCDCAGEGVACDDGNIYTVNDKYDVYCNCLGEYLDSDEDGVLDGVDACLDQSYEAEFAEVYDVAFRNSVPQFSGLGYIDYLHSNNDYIEFTVNAVESGEHQLAFRYALESGNRPLELSIDGQVVVASLDFPASGSWSEWDTVSVEHSLTAGAHTVKLLAIGSSGGNIDKLILSYCTGCPETGTPCDDDLICTTDDVIGADCNCGGKYEDTDLDGVCNVLDSCEGHDDSADSDGDGTPDGCDECDDNLIGTTCDDNDPCTENDIYNVDCHCAGTFVGADSDGDGVCDDYDICPNGNDAFDADGDGVPDACDPCDDRTIGNPCDDGDPCTLLDVVTPDCGCNGFYFDSDGDGVCTALDLCEGFDDSIDNDGDGMPDACDLNIPITDKIEIGKVFGVTENWMTIQLDNVYESMVVVATIVMANNDQQPALVRVRNANVNSFELRIQHPSPSTSFDFYNVEFIVVEEGVYTANEIGFNMEARKELSIETAGSIGGYTREERDYLQPYTYPVIVGQVMTYNDSRFSQFWSSRHNVGGNPADSVGFAAGKQIAQDTIIDRLDETIGFIIIEAGNYSLDGLRFEAKVGDNTVSDVVGSDEGYPYKLNLEAANHAVLSISGVNGSDGGWPVLFGEEPHRGSTMYLAWDEDMIYDTERYHTEEEISYLAFEFTQPLAVPTVAAINTSCNGAADGSATVSISGGEEPYSYAWSNGGIGATINDLAAGSYTVTITDDNGTTKLATATIDQPTAIDANMLGNPITCNGANDGYVLAITFGGTGQHSYAWSNGESGPEISDLQPGLYTLTVTDENGCTTINEYTVTEPAELQAFATGNDVDCFDGNDGSITTTFSGGTGNLTYQWSNGATTKDIQNLSAGIYTITTTDGNGCTATASYTISQPDQLVVSTSSTFVSCNGGADGSATAIHVGGSGNADYLWSNGETTETIENLSTGTYTVTITDENGCTASSSVNLTDPAMLAVDATGNDVSCFGTIDGQAEAIYTGGTGDVTYLWSNGENTATITDLEPGVYTVTTTDENGCEASTTIIIDEPDALTVSTSSEAASCFGENDGSATVQPAGGVGDYTALWSTGDATMQIFDLTAGVYTVTITDANGCEIVEAITVAQPSALQVQLTVNQVSCFGDSDGSISILASGGTGQVSYLWSTNDTTASLNDLPAGAYSLTITDENGCTSDDVVIVGSPDELQITLDQVVDAIGANADGAIEITTSGGTAGYTYQWFLNNDLISEEEDPADLAAGEYMLMLTDANGCVITFTVEVNSITSAEERNLSQYIYLTPNPTSGRFSVVLDFPTTNQAMVSIFDAAGRVVLANIPVVEQYDFDLSEKAAGVYMLKIQIGEIEVTKRVVVSK